MVRTVADILLSYRKCEGDCPGEAKNAVLILGTDMAFCQHHTDRYRVSLEAQGAVIVSLVEDPADPEDLNGSVPEELKDADPNATVRQVFVPQAGAVVVWFSVRGDDTWAMGRTRAEAEKRYQTTGSGVRLATLQQYLRTGFMADEADYEEHNHE